MEGEQVPWRDSASQRRGTLRFSSQGLGGGCGSTLEGLCPVLIRVTPSLVPFLPVFPWAAALQWALCSGLSRALFHTWQQHQVLPGCCYLKPSGNPMNCCQPRVGMSGELAHTRSVPPSTRQTSAFSFLCGIKAFPHTECHDGGVDRGS